MLLYGEHRHAVLTGQVELTGDNFVTDFHRRAFEAILSLEGSDGGYDFSLLGESFSPDEMGRLSRLEQARRALTDNGTSVLRAAIATLARERDKRVAKDAEPVEGINLILAGKRKQINKQ